MYYYLINRDDKRYCISGHVDDFGSHIETEEVAIFVKRSMINNRKIELINEEEMSILDEKHDWLEFKKWMK